MPTQTFDTVLKSSDPDRRLAALFAPAQLRDQLMALYAFNHEVARIAEATSESLIGEMKLTWWRDAVSDLYASPARVRRHDVPEALAELTSLIEESDLQDLVAARLDDVTARPFADLDEVIAYVDRTAGGLMRLAAQVCEVEVDPDLLREAGRAWGLSGLLRAFPYRAQIGRAPVGLDSLEKEGASAAMLGQGLGAEKVSRALEPVRHLAASAAERFCAAPLPAELVPVLGYAVLVPAYLQRLPADPYALAGQPPLLLRQARLTWLSLTGR